MAHKSVCVLDVRSMSVTAIVGAAGVNNTFVFKGSQSQEYDGYEDGRFYKEGELKKAVYAALEAAEGSAGEHVKTVYVSVPGEFSKIVDKKHLIAFPAPKRIASGDIDVLYKDGYGSVEEPSHENIHASALYFITSDARKVTDPTGIVSSTLQANVCYILAACYYTDLFRQMLREYGFRKVVFVPASYMQAVYLLSEDKRKEGALLLDIGAISSTVSVVYGDGILKERTFWAGEGHIAAELCAGLSVSYEDAAELLKRANLFRTGVADVCLDEERRFSTDKVNEYIKAGLDKLCEPLGQFLDECPAPVANRPLLMTGEGVTGLRGAAEHISRRINRETEIVSPAIPYYNKPSMSSRISLLDYALRDSKKDGFLYKLINGFGG